jgi:phage baseplate assembly protein gpV
VSEYSGTKDSSAADTSKARIYFPDHTVQEYDDQAVAYQVWLALPGSVRAAFRGADDPTPVYEWDYVNRTGR